MEECPVRPSTLRSSRAAALAAVLLAPAPALAAGGPTDGDKAMPCRPTFACTAELSAPGTVEIEAGYLFQHAAGGANQRLFPFLIKLTAATWAQIQIGSNGFTDVEGDVPARFFDNVALTFKANLLDQGHWAPALALSATGSLPTAAGQEGYVQHYDATFAGYVTRDFGPIHADLNGGVNLWQLEDHPLAQGFGALALSADLSPVLKAPFGIMAEVYALSDASPVAAHDGAVLVALSLTPKSWLIFDLGGSSGFFPATRAYSVFAGLTVVPAVLWRPRAAH
jgi:hypothetical protein